MVVVFAVVFALSVPLVFLVVVRGFNVYEKKRLVDADQDIRLDSHPARSPLQKRSLFQRLQDWLQEWKNNFPLYQNNFLTIVGGIIAYLLAAQINPLLVNSGLLSRVMVLRVAGPFIEEILKSIIIFYLVFREDFTIAKGAIFGFGAGIGFAVVENIEYILPRQDIAFTVAFSRVFSTNLVHATGSGLIASAVSYLKFYRAKRDYLLAIFAILAAIGLHMGFNTMVGVGTYLVVALAVGLSGGSLILFVINRANKRHGSYAAEIITADKARASHNEAVIVSSEEGLKRVFKEVEAKFSTKHAMLVDDFLKTQSDIITKRKILEVTKDKKTIARLEKDIDDLITHTNIIRNKLGTYCMVFVRTRYTFDEKLWPNIQNKIAAANTGQKGGGVWDMATSRIKQSKSQEENKSS